MTAISGQWRNARICVAGFSLIEVLIGVFLSAFLISGIVQLLSSSTHAYRLQLSQSQLAESARYARSVLVSHINQAGYQHEPWITQSQIPAVTTHSVNGSTLAGDQLGLQRWSRMNCYGNENPARDSHGQPAFHLLKVSFRVNKSNNLSMSCRYGPDTSRLHTQINNFGLVEGVESMQVLYAENQLGDGGVDNWVTGQAWQNEIAVRAIRIALLMATKDNFNHGANGQITLLDHTLDRPADGRLRKVVSFTATIRGRL